MIPHVFHRIWTGPPMPEVFERFGEGWQRLHPEWEMQFWGDADLRDLQNQDLYDRASAITPGFEGQLRADIARYEILYQHGGVYIDTDFECVKPIDEVLEGVGCFAAWAIQDQVANNAIMGATPGHPFMRLLIDTLPASIAARPGKRPNQISGPHHLTRQLKAYGPGVTVFPEAWFHPYQYGEWDRCNETFPDAYAIHHWANGRRLKGRPL